MKAEDTNRTGMFGIFLRKLGFWAIHGVISALPGFFCAMMIMDSPANNKLAAVFPMLAATLTCVLVLAGLFTFLEARKPLNELVKKGLTAGLRIRILMVVGGLLILAASDSLSYKGMMLVPDAWIGLGAGIINYWVCEAFGIRSGLENLERGGGDQFGTIYALSMTVALIIGLMIFILSFISTLFFQMRKRKAFILESSV